MKLRASFFILLFVLLAMLCTMSSARKGRKAVGKHKAKRWVKKNKKAAKRKAFDALRLSLGGHHIKPQVDLTSKIPVNVVKKSAAKWINEANVVLGQIEPLLEEYRAYHKKHFRKANTIPSLDALVAKNLGFRQGVQVLLEKAESKAKIVTEMKKGSGPIIGLTSLVVKIGKARKGAQAVFQVSWDEALELRLKFAKKAPRSNADTIKFADILSKISERDPSVKTGNNR